MKNIINTLICPLISLALLSGCNSSSQQNENASTPSDEIVVGNDRDEYGCLRSAGYTWSEVLNNCIRPWEEGIKLSTAADSTSTSAVYLVFNADSTQLEVFLPSSEQRPILDREHTDMNSWVNLTDTEYSVQQRDGKWILLHNGKWIYKN